MGRWLAMPWLWGLFIALAGCGGGLSYRMVRPQVSVVNHFIGPDLEVSFEFLDDAIGLSLVNSGDSDLAVDWSQASFVGADGRAVPLVTTGKPLLGTLPLGSSTQVVVRPSEYGVPPGQLWHRRAYLEERLVPPSLLERCSPMVRIMLPVMRYASPQNASQNEFEMNEFIFQVVPARPDSGNEGGGYDASNF